MDRAYTKNANKTKKKCVHTNSEEVYRKEAVRLTRATRPTNPYNTYILTTTTLTLRLSTTATRCTTPIRVTGVHSGATRPC